MLKVEIAFDTSCGRVRFLDGHFFQWLQALALLFVLFGPDIVAMTSASNPIDPYIDALLIASMAIFSLDLVLSILCRPKISLLEVRCCTDHVLLVVVAKQLWSLL